MSPGRREGGAQGGGAEGKRTRREEEEAPPEDTGASPATATVLPVMAALESANVAKRSGRKRMRTSDDGVEYKMPHQQRWDEMFERLKDYKANFGHCNVPNRHQEDTQLGSWVSAQRRQYRIITQGGNGSAALTPDRASKLARLGFQWTTTNPHHTPWEVRYEGLKEFVSRFGHSEVPMRWIEDPKLSHWVSKQRHDFKLRQEGKSPRMSDEKIKLLEDVGFCWEGSRRSISEKVQAIEPSSESEVAASQVTPSQGATSSSNRSISNDDTQQTVVGSRANNHSSSENSEEAAAAPPSRFDRASTTALAAPTFGALSASQVSAIDAAAYRQSLLQPSIADAQPAAMNFQTQNLLSHHHHQAGSNISHPSSTSSQSGQNPAGDFQQLLAALGAGGGALQDQNMASLLATPAGNAVTSIHQALALSQQLQTAVLSGMPPGALEHAVSTLLMGGQPLQQFRGPTAPGAPLQANGPNPMQQSLWPVQQLEAGAPLQQPGSSNLTQQLSSLLAPPGQQTPANMGALLQGIQQAALQQAFGSVIQPIASQQQQHASLHPGAVPSTVVNPSTQLVLVVPVNAATMPSFLPMNLAGTSATTLGNDSGGIMAPFMINLPTAPAANTLAIGNSRPGASVATTSVSNAVDATLTPPPILAASSTEQKEVQDSRSSLPNPSAEEQGSGGGGGSAPSGNPEPEDRKDQGGTNDQDGDPPPGSGSCPV